MNCDSLYLSLITLAKHQKDVEEQLYVVKKGKNMDVYNETLYSQAVKTLYQKLDSLIAQQDEIAMKAFYLIFNDLEKNKKLNITWTVDNSNVLVDVILNTKGEYKELFDAAYNRLEAWTYVDASQDTALEFSIKEYQFNEKVSFYEFIESVLPKLNVKDLEKWQKICSKLYGLKNKRLFNEVIENSFDKSHKPELAVVCEYLFSKEGYAFLISDFLSHVIKNTGSNTISQWTPNYSIIPNFSALPFIQQKLIEMYFKPIFMRENLSLLLRLENAVHESVTE